jgi:hypothetical protein
MRGLHVSYGEQRSDHELIEADTIVLCAGQEPQRALLAPLQAAGRSVHLIGGAELAAELDAKRAIDQGAVGGAAVIGARFDVSMARAAVRRFGWAMGARLFR